MNKTFLLIVIVILIAAALFSSWFIFLAPEHYNQSGIEFDYPKGWTVSQMDNETPIYFMTKELSASVLFYGDTQLPTFLVVFLSNVKNKSYQNVLSIQSPSKDLKIIITKLKSPVSSSNDEPIGDNLKNTTTLTANQVKYYYDEKNKVYYFIIIEGDYEKYNDTIKMIMKSFKVE